VDKRFIVILVVLILGLGGLFLYNKSKSAPSTTTTTTASVSNHTKGNTTSKVNLVVYGDFQCPACERFFPLEKQIVDKYIDKISFTFRHYPLDGTHPNARAASRAAEAAGKQGKFFEMHDLLYQQQSSWVNMTDPTSVLEQLAKSLGLNADQFKSDYASEAVNATINADKKEGDTKNISGTPSYFLNGEELNLEDIQTVDLFSAKIDNALKNSQ
jgi:protein-disulfide isomerase